MNVKTEIEAAKQDIQKLISEINQLAFNIDQNFVNIGNKHVAESLRSTANYYRKVKNNLDNLLGK
jgi:PP-loop superfamily ATP-utilizing enzyme